jgi:hypothetical protein
MGTLPLAPHFTSPLKRAREKEEAQRKKMAKKKTGNNNGARENVCRKKA